MKKIQESIIKKDKKLGRATKQSKIRHVRHSQKYMLGYLILRSYTEALEFDKANNNSNGMIPLGLKWCLSICIIYSMNMRSPSLIDTGKLSTHHQATRKSESTESLLSSMMEDTKLDW